MYCKFRGKCSKYTPHRKECGAVGTRMELHYFQSFLTGGAEGTFNPTLSHTILIPCRHNMADSMCTKTTSDCPDVPSATSGSSLSSGRPFLQHCRGRQVVLQSTSAQVFWGVDSGVGIDGEALFMHPPCSSKKSVSFSRLSVCLSLTGTPFAKWRLFLGDTGRTRTMGRCKTSWVGARERLQTLRARASKRGGCGGGWEVAVQR